MSLPGLTRGLLRALSRPRYYLERDIAPLAYLIGARPSRLSPEDSLGTLVRRLCLAHFDDGRGHLLEARRIPELLWALRDWTSTGKRLVCIRRDGGVAQALGPHSSLAGTFSALRGARRVMLWARDEAQSHSYCLEILSSPPGFYRNRALRALARDIPRASSGELFSNYAALWAESTQQFIAPVDVVFTWVNGADPHFRELLAKHKAAAPIDADRFRDSGELCFALRSVHYNLPWIRQIFVVSNCTRPSWLGQQGVTWVEHQQILPSHALPTFNSHVIEAALQRIPGLAEHFIYLNDDMFVNEACDAGQFFTSTGKSLAFLESFGSVAAYHPSTIPLDQVWQFAALRGADLLRQRFGRRPTQHHRHVPYALRKSVLEALVQEFSTEFATLSGQRFRSPHDLSPTSFLYHHYALEMGAAERGTCTETHVQRRNFRALSARVLSGQAGDFLCLNDGGSLAHLEAFERFKQKAMRRLFPLAAPWELETMP